MVRIGALLFILLWHIHKQTKLWAVLYVANDLTHDCDSRRALVSLLAGLGNHAQTADTTKQRRDQPPTRTHQAFFRRAWILLIFQHFKQFHATTIAAIAVTTATVETDEFTNVNKSCLYCRRGLHLSYCVFNLIGRMPTTRWFSNTPCCSEDDTHRCIAALES